MDAARPEISGAIMVAPQNFPSLESVALRRSCTSASARTAFGDPDLLTPVDATAASAGTPICRKYVLYATHLQSREIAGNRRIWRPTSAIPPAASFSVAIASPHPAICHEVSAHRASGRASLWVSEFWIAYSFFVHRQFNSTG